MFSKKSRNVINLISLISLFGLLVSAASLVVILSGFNGIQKYVEDLLAENVVNNAIKEGDKILVDQNKKGDNLQLKINQKVETS